MARVARDRVLIVDTIYMGDDAGGGREAPRSRRTSATTPTTSGRELVVEAGLGLDDVRFFPHPFDYQAWLDRCRLRRARRAERVPALWGERVADGRLTLDKIAIRAVKGA